MAKLRLKKKGFTLIELLLVLIVIAVIVLYASLQLREKAHDKTINDTKNEMENWLQAITSYYVIEEKWPTELKDLITNDYMTDSAECSSWPLVAKKGIALCPKKSNYQLSCPGSECDPNNDKYMGIKLSVPTEDAAVRIAAVLASANITKMPDATYTVASYIPIPSIVSEQHTQERHQWGWIASAGALRSGHESCTQKRSLAAATPQAIVLPQCGEGYEAHYMQFYLKQRTGRARPTAPERPFAELGTTCFRPFNILPINPLDKCCVQQSRNHSYVVLGIGDSSHLDTATPWLTANLVHDHVNGGYDYKYQYYITLCLPNGSWYPGGAMSLSPNDARQCGGDWKKVNSGSGVTCGYANASPEFR